MDFSNIEKLFSEEEEKKEIDIDLKEIKKLSEALDQETLGDMYKVLAKEAFSKLLYFLKSGPIYLQVKIAQFIIKELLYPVKIRPEESIKILFNDKTINLSSNPTIQKKEKLDYSFKEYLNINWDKYIKEATEKSISSTHTSNKTPS